MKNLGVQRSPFVSTLEELSRKGPIKLLGAGLLVGIFAGIQAMLEVDFECPCQKTFNAPYGLVFFFLPGISFAVLNVLIRKYGKYQCGSSKCTEFTGTSWRQLLTRIFTPIFLWGVVVLLDGDTVACIASDNCRSLKKEEYEEPYGYLVVCRVKEETADDSEESCYRFYVFVSRILGLCLVAAMAFVSFVLKFSYICGKDCTVWEEDRQKTYEESAQRLNEDTLMEVLLEKSKDRTAKDVNKALDEKDKPETFWTKAQNIMKNVSLPDDGEKGEKVDSSPRFNARHLEEIEAATEIDNMLNTEDAFRSE